MRGVLLRHHGSPDSLRVETLPDPVPGAGEVLIDVRAAGVNFADVLARQGLYPEAPRYPYVPGYESAGTVMALGPGANGVRVGDRVVAYHVSGGYADRVAAAAERVFRIPDGLSFQSAVVLPLNYGTAYLSLYRTGPVEPGMRVFIHAAAGGVGLAAVDLGRRAGLEMTGAAGTHFKRARLIHAGVKHVVSSRYLRVDRVADSLYSGPAYDIVLDSVGGRFIRESRYSGGLLPIQVVRRLRRIGPSHGHDARTDPPSRLGLSTVRHERISSIDRNGPTEPLRLSHERSRERSDQTTHPQPS
jgi:NADPH:quinone reductase-like Zn-dependent oxidoreductase